MIITQKASYRRDMPDRFHPIPMSTDMAAIFQLNPTITNNILKCETTEEEAHTNKEASITQFIQIKNKPAITTMYKKNNECQTISVYH